MKPITLPVIVLVALLAIRSVISAPISANKTQSKKPVEKKERKPIQKLEKKKNKAKAPEKKQPQKKQTVIVVVGAEGNQQYGEQFKEWASRWEKACSKGGANYLSIGLDATVEATDHHRLRKMLVNESKVSGVALWIVLIGHGTFDSKSAKFNLRGPDLSARELATWLEPLQRPVALINTSASSAPFIRQLTKPGRVIVTATKSGYERNYTRFGNPLSRAIADPGADLDKDGQTSLLEAFLVASHRVEEFYQSEQRLATEHALIDDNGDALGSRADWFRGVRAVKKHKNSRTPDGYYSHQFHLVRSEAERRIPPELRARRDLLELAVFKLRGSKNTIPEDQYYQRLEKLLIEIAHIYAQVDRLEKKSASPPPANKTIDKALDSGK